MIMVSSEVDMGPYKLSLFNDNYKWDMCLRGLGVFAFYQFIGACKEPVMVIVTELLLGGTLRKYLLNLRPRCLDMRVAVGFALDIARAMECLHSHGIIHRDLKPGMVHISFWLNANILSSSSEKAVTVTLSCTQWFVSIYES